MGFIQIIDEDEEILQLILRRRSRLIAKYLQRQRITMKRIETGRTVDFTTYVGLWFNDYPELQFQKDLRFTKTAFRVYKHWNQLRSLLYQFLSFQRLVEITSPAIMGGRDGYHGIPVSDKLMMVVWTLANREAYRVLGRRFALNRGTILMKL